MNFLNLIVVEFSLAQNAFHKETVKEMLWNNMNNILDSKQRDYVPIGMFINDEDADVFINTYYDSFKKHVMYNSVNGDTVIR